MENLENQNEQIIETVDEDGNVVKFELIDIIEYENKEYGILSPQEQEENEEDEVVVMRLKKEGEDFIFEYIEDDNEFERVTTYINELFSDDDEEEGE